MIEDKLCILVCDVYKTEMRSVLKSGDFPDVELVTYPHVCVRTPSEKDKLENTIDKCRNAYKYVTVLYGKCDYRFKDKDTAPRLDRMASFFHCLELITSHDLLNYLQSQKNCYIVTPGWLRTWKEHIKFWKFDQDTARQFFKESTTGICLLDTGIFDDSNSSLKEFADFIGLPFDSIDIGLDHLKHIIKGHVTEWRIALYNQSKETQMVELNKEISNYKMMCQVAGSLGKLEEENKVITTATDFIKILAGIATIIYVPVVDNEIKDPVPRVPISKKEQEIINDFHKSDADYSWHSSDTGFIIRLRQASETIGILYAKNALFQERLPDYLNMVLAITNPVSLAISNARYYERLSDAQKLLSIQASTDALTGILNRRTIIERLNTEIVRAEREHKALSIAMMDIDHFKNINDSYGHAAGDKVLLKIVEQAKSSIRPYDYIGRFGGEEFLIIIPGADAADASAICERILSRIENLTVEWETGDINVTVSLGVSTYPGMGKINTDDLINLADNALYRAKNEGRNRVVHYNTIIAPEKR